MSGCGLPSACLTKLRHPIKIVRRTLAPAMPGSAEPVHDYSDVFSARAQIETRGSAPWQGTNAETGTHTFTLRYTSTVFDVRDRIRDGRGNYYKITSIENVDNANSIIKISAQFLGPDGTEANQ